MNAKIFKTKYLIKEEAIRRIKEGIEIARKKKRPDLVKALKRIALMDLGYRV